ncbi:MAG: hypothetical protein ACRDN9_18570 [Streptosporangiaceae bacterium]
MLRRTHRRRPPVPAGVMVALLVAAVVAAAVAAVARDPTVARGGIVAVVAVVGVEAALVFWLRRRLRRGDLRFAQVSSAVARAERLGVREVLRRERRIAQLCLRVDTLQTRLDEATSASLYVATVLATLDRANRAAIEAEPDGEAEAVADAGGNAAERASADEVAEPDAGEQLDTKNVAAIAIAPASGPMVQIWPSLDDAPTVVDLLRYEDVRRAVDEGDAAASGRSA